MTAAPMQGFPPAPHGQVTLANWRMAPFSRWAFHHVREILPTAEIAHDPASVRDLPAAPLDLSGLTIHAPGGQTTTLARFAEETTTDGLVILHRGKIVHEQYANGMTARAPHILMSVSKSMLGLLAGILAGEGVLDVEAPVTSIIPEVTGTAYDGATVRHLLDMRAGLRYDENYLAASGPIIAYRKATGWNPLAPGETASDLRSFFRELHDREGPHGGKFAYISPNTDLLGWVIERAGGKRYADLMGELLWAPMGAAEPASITVDRLGAPRAAGGMCTTTRDLARVGQLLIEGGARGGRQIVPARWIDDITNGGDPDAWDRGSFIEFYPGRHMHYRAKWYVERGPKPVLFGLGIHGQNVFADARNEIVIAKHSSQAQPLDAGLIALTTAFVDAVRRALAA